jgi:hypothetical protein
MGVFLRPHYNLWLISGHIFSSEVNTGSTNKLFAVFHTARELITVFKRDTLDLVQG